MLGHSGFNLTNKPPMFCLFKTRQRPRVVRVLGQPWTLLESQQTNFQPKTTLNQFKTQNHIKKILTSIYFFPWYDECGKTHQFHFSSKETRGHQIQLFCSWNLSDQQFMQTRLMNNKKKKKNHHFCSLQFQCFISNKLNFIYKIKH